MYYIKIVKIYELLLFIIYYNLHIIIIFYLISPINFYSEKLICTQKIFIQQNICMYVCICFNIIVQFCLINNCFLNYIT